MLSFSFTLTLLSTFITSISAHGYVQGILVAGKTYYSGYHPNFQYRNPIPIVAGWSDPEDISNGYISPSSYSHPDIICHLSATPGGTAVQVSAGSTLDLQWTTWPHSHHGPVLDYLARCPEDSCKDVDKTKLNFVKIAESGLMSWDAMPGKWASDVLISNNHSWSITIPPTLPPGSYVLRHEIIALHSANQPSGAQHYPQCFNLEILSSSSSQDLSAIDNGIPATEFYHSNDPGLAIDIYRQLSSYAIPGPKLWSGAVEKAGGNYAGLPTESSISSASHHSSHFTSTATMTTMITTTTTTAGPSPYSKIQALIDALPTDALTRKVDVGSSMATGAVADVWGERPGKELPEGWTMRDLLGWVQYVMKGVWKGEGGDEQGRSKREILHGRD